MRKYPAEFQERAVKLAVESEQPIAQTARDLGVNENTLHTWIGKYHWLERQEQQLSDAHLYEEWKRLRKENARLKEERDILKKAAAVLCATAAVKYAWRHQQYAEAKVKHYFAQACGTFGTRRIKYLLAQEGLQVSRCRLGRLLTQADLRCKTRRRCKVPTTSGHA
jgi:transposase